MGKKVQNNSQKKETDVYCENTKYRYIIECKSWSNFKNKQAEIEQWINDKYHFFVEWNNRKNKDEERKKLRIYFIMSLKNQGVITDVNEQFKNYELITFYDQTFLDELAKKHNQKEIRAALKCFITK